MPAASNIPEREFTTCTHTQTCMYTIARMQARGPKLTDNLLNKLIIWRINTNDDRATLNGSHTDFDECLILSQSDFWNLHHYSVFLWFGVGGLWATQLIHELQSCTVIQGFTEKDTSLLLKRLWHYKTKRTAWQLWEGKQRLRCMYTISKFRWIKKQYFIGKLY